MQTAKAVGTDEIKASFDKKIFAPLKANGFRQEWKLDSNTRPSKFECSMSASEQGWLDNVQSLLDAIKKITNEKANCCFRKSTKDCTVEIHVDKDLLQSFGFEEAQTRNISEPLYGGIRSYQSKAGFIKALLAIRDTDPARDQEKFLEYFESLLRYEDGFHHVMVPPLNSDGTNIQITLEGSGENFDNYLFEFRNHILNSLGYRLGKARTDFEWIKAQNLVDADNVTQGYIVEIEIKALKSAVTAALALATKDQPSADLAAAVLAPRPAILHAAASAATAEVKPTAKPSVFQQFLSAVNDASNNSTWEPRGVDQKTQQCEQIVSALHNSRDAANEIMHNTLRQLGIPDPETNTPNWAGIVKSRSAAGYRVCFEVKGMQESLDKIAETLAAYSGAGLSNSFV